MRRIKKIISSILMLIPLAVIPASVVILVFYTLLTNADYYTGIVKRLHLIETLIVAKNTQIENNIKNEIEQKTGISAYKQVFEKKKNDYNAKMLEYNRINKTDEYEKIEKMIDQLDDREWNNSKNEFSTEKDFDVFKDKKMDEYKAARKAIKEYRKTNDDAIGKAEDLMDVSTKEFKDAKSEMEDRESAAKKILDDKRDEFMTSIFSDIEKIEPVLTEKLNTLFIDTEISGMMKSYISFFRSYDVQKREGNVGLQRFEINSGLVENQKIVKLPKLSLSFRVQETAAGVTLDRNLLSEVFVRNVEQTKGLKNQWLLVKLLSMSDSWLFERLAGSVLKGTGLVFENGTISTSGPIILKGRTAEKTERVMIAATYGKYLVFAVPALILLFVCIIISASSSKRKGFRRVGAILEYSSILAILVCIAEFVFAFMPWKFITLENPDPVVTAFLEKAFPVAALYTAVPLACVFGALFLVGVILKRAGKNSKKKTDEQQDPESI